MSDRNGLEIAVIGLAGRFPGAPDLDRFWSNLRDGVESVSFFTPEELAASGIPAATSADPRYVPANAFLEDTDRFDADFFDLSPREAEVIDPQQRLLLECASEALERAGYAGTGRAVGVFAGVSQNTYLMSNLATDPDVWKEIGVFGMGVASEKDFAATRLSYKLDLSGPSVNVQTACSTSLVAVHLACQSLLAGECEIALAGAASVRVPQKAGHLYLEGGINSPDGHCRTFDARAQGTVGGQGVAVVVLKLLEDALADGDTVHAVIKGSALNNDGSAKAGFTAPSREGQMQAIRAAQLRAGVDPDTITYVEAHGTATPIGDPIEVAALTWAFRLATERRGFCALGSVKSNLGHLDAAAGMAGLVKTILALENREIPPSLHYTAPNPQIDFAASPFYVNTRLAPWEPAPGAPRRAGVSSFGLGGTNAHLILEEAPHPPAPSPIPSQPPGEGENSRPAQLLVLSARSPTALERMTDDLAKYLISTAEPIPDIAWTLEAGRRRFRHRRVLVTSGAADAAEVLAARDPRRVWTSEAEGDRPIAFLLPGVGDHYPGMASRLYATEPVFRAELDRCAELARPHLGLDLREALFAGALSKGGEGLNLRALVRGNGPATDRTSGPLADTAVAQPTVFAVGWALARLWISWGIRPRALLGYSLGEYTAACLAGVLTLADAIALVAGRARLIAQLPPGTMLAVPLPEEEMRRRLPAGGTLSLAAVNAPAVCVASGGASEVAALESVLAAEGIPCRRLAASHAFHSAAMRPIAGAFLELVRSVRLAPPQVPYLSNVTGTWIENGQATDPEYWVRHLLGTVRFADAAGALWREPGRILIEMGPGPSLGSLALQHPESGGGTALASLPHELDRQDDQVFLLHSLARLWLAGVEPDWTAFHAGEQRRRVPLPTYPFERRRFWIERRTTSLAELTGRLASPAAGKLPDMADWFHAPSWKLALPPRLEARAETPQRWLLLIDSAGIGARLAERLRADGEEIEIVAAGDEEALRTALARSPGRIVHLWTLGAASSWKESQDLGFHSLIALAQALAGSGETAIDIVTDGLCKVERADRVRPEKATLLGPLRVIPQEYPHVTCRALDVDPGDLDDGLIDRLLAELRSPVEEPLVAWRGEQRWVPAFVAARCEPAVAFLPSPGDRAGGAGRGAGGEGASRGVYLITGGFGGIGLALAGHLARTSGARLALLGRSAGSERAARAVGELEAAGAEVLALAADVTDEAAVRAAVERVRSRFGRLDGVFHAAGVPGAGLIQRKTREAAEAVLAPKAAGTLALDAALRGNPPDFLVLFSSITAVTGGIGQVDYCAANAFLDAFAQRPAPAFPTVSIDWCEWQWDAWTGASILDAGLQAELQRRRQGHGLSFAEGMEALSRILASGLGRVMVSTRDLGAVLAERHSLRDVLSGLASLAETAARPEEPGGRREHDRPEIGVPYVAPGDATEERLAAIWQGLLGLRRVGIHDDFFQLGGHSLLGLQLLARVKAAFAIELPLRALFDTPTIAGLAAAITGEHPAAAPALERIAPVDAEDLLEGIDGLSDDEMTALLTRMMAEEQER
jgi:acyl transferase domain-containing protein/acyl carrier protein